MKSVGFLVLLLLGLQLGFLLASLEHPFHIRKSSSSPAPGSLENPSAKHVVEVNRKGGGGGRGGRGGGGGRSGGIVGSFPVIGGSNCHHSGSNRLLSSAFNLNAVVLLFTGFSTAILQYV